LAAGIFRKKSPKLVKMQCTWNVPQRGSNMQRYANEAIEKLTRIEQLWKQLKSTKTDTLEYRSIVKEIGVLSMEYQKLAEAGRKLEEQK
jgi:hypothetical protein